MKWLWDFPFLTAHDTWQHRLNLPLVSFLQSVRTHTDTHGHTDTCPAKMESSDPLLGTGDTMDAKEEDKKERETLEPIQTGNTVVGKYI